MDSYSGLKADIHRHRSYRKLHEINRMKIILEIIFTIILCDALIVLFYPQITLLMNKVTGFIISPFFENIKLITSDFLLGDIFLLEIAGKYPDLNFSVLIAILSSISLFIVILQNVIPQSISIWLIFAIILTLLSSLYFIFFPEYFPYSMGDFLDLYVKTSICIWLIIPWIIMFSFIPLPIHLGTKIIYVLLLILYAIIFTIIRYVVFIFILRFFSLLFMAPLYFILGPFLDFVYIIGFYALVVSKLARKIDKQLPEWKWSF